jgi:hypothetical protein
MSKCKNPDCKKRNPKVRSWQKFCSKQCRETVRNLRAKGLTVTPTAFDVVDAAMAWHAFEGNFEATATLRAACALHAAGGGLTPGEVEALQF